MAKPDHSIDPLILVSAKREFLEKGFKKASLKDICAKANVTTGALYKRYKGKDALFCAVVEDTVNDLNEIYEQKSVIDFSGISDQELIKAWDMDESYMMWWFHFLFDRHEGFVLLLKCAEGSSYSNFQHDWVEKMTEATYLYYMEAYKRKLTLVFVSKKEMHILLTAFWSTIYEPFIHDYTLDQLEDHCQLVCRMFDWYSTFQFDKNYLSE